ncbi:class I SAM-dependent methyltransferase [Fimbriiglobus ruber]|uniref:Methyltransferase n=1 Tax=Fimbriiglobus ruber TaxID=1908690 RepID=A0A225DCJ3_9BACT|nr:class I SAM-dependent methyltransferase [Fimbriiglobus ruber]OWK34849.1 Methyltransferase [Fimbriiglobus ruber]
MIPDWQLPPGVDRGLWDYLHSSDMVRGYDAQMAASALASADTAFCETAFPRPGRLIDLGCGTGRLCIHFARRGYDCTGVDLSPEMLAQARENAAKELGEPRSPNWAEANLVDLAGVADESFHYAACLFSTLGMVRGSENRAAVLRSAHRVLKPGGRFVLHVHNRWFRELGWSRVISGAFKSLVGNTTAGDMTMPQAYGGAALTLHHFSQSETVDLLTRTGFSIAEMRPVDLIGGRAKTRFGTYGYLIAAEKPAR